MPQGLPNVVPNEVIASSHINNIADRIVGRFATNAERDAAILTPVNGMVVSVNGVLQIRTGGVWDIVNKNTGYYEVAYRTTNIVVAVGSFTTVASSVKAGCPAGKYLAFGIMQGWASAICNGQYKLVYAAPGFSGESPHWEWEIPANNHGARGTNVGTAIWPFTIPTAGQVTVNLAALANMSAGFLGWEESTVGFVYLGT